MSSLPCGTRNYSYAEDMAICPHQDPVGAADCFPDISFYRAFISGQLLAGCSQSDRHYPHFRHRPKYSGRLLRTALHRPCRIYGGGRLYFGYFEQQTGSALSGWLLFAPV